MIQISLSLLSYGCVFFQPSHKCSEGRFVKILLYNSNGIVLITDVIDGYGFFIQLVVINSIEIVIIFVFHNELTVSLYSFKLSVIDYKIHKEHDVSFFLPGTFITVKYIIYNFEIDVWGYLFCANRILFYSVLFLPICILYPFCHCAKSALNSSVNFRTWFYYKWQSWKALSIIN